MSNLVGLIFIMSVVASVIFGIVLLLEYIYQTEYVEYVYFIMKVVLIIYAVPVCIMVLMIFMNSMEYTIRNIAGIDVVNVKNIRMYSIDMLSQKTSIIMLLFGTWLIGTILTFIHSFVKGQRLLKQLICNSDKIISKEVQDLELKLRLELGAKKVPELYKSNIVNASFLTGIIKPRIIFPNKRFCTEEWEMMLRHELMHLKKNDLIFKMFIGIIQSVHWFNPIIYYYKRMFFNFCEYACDKRATEFFNKEQRSRYARLIVGLSESEFEYKQVTAFADTNYKVLERRVKEIMRIPKKEKSALLIGTLAAFMAICPIVTYASVTGVMGIQSELVRSEVHRGMQEDYGVGKVTEIDEILKDNAGVMVALSNPRGINNIDIYVPATGVSIFNTLSLNSGQKVSFSLASDKSSDSFSFSIANSAGKGKRYTASDGVVSGSYTVPSTGDYKIYIDGYNYGGDDIHVTGMIRIE